MSLAINKTRIDRIDAFVKAEKASGRWSSIRRLYLPIWGVAGANRFCLKSQVGGVFNGTWTHSAGFATATVSASYFDTNSYNDRVFGGNAFILGGLSRNTINAALGGFGTTSERSLELRNGILSTNSVDSLTFTSNSLIGIVIGWFDGATRGVSRRRLAAYTEIASGSATVAGGRSSASFFFNARNNNTVFDNKGQAFASTNVQWGAWFSGLYMDDATRQDFSLSLKDVWESLTGLTLP